MEGIDITKLDVGTKLEINTANSTYNFEVTEKERYLLCQGGRHLPHWKMVYIPGKRIEHGMQISMYIDKARTLVTSPVKGARVIGESWEYQMDWG